MPQGKLRRLRCWVMGAWLAGLPLALRGAEPIAPLRAEDADPRPPRDDTELRTWLEIMIWHHRFEPAEITAATGLTAGEIESARQRLQIGTRHPAAQRPDEPLRVFPYPGGRHPRRGFLEGAVRPQRETKLSVFCPWDSASYVVADIPEAVFSNLGLIYLAHTHVPTVWTAAGVELERLEWQTDGQGRFVSSRRLPNGITLTTRAQPTPAAVRMQMTLTNGTSERLTGLRVQNCVMLKQAAGFEESTNDNKRFQSPYAACRSADGRRWIITGWSPCQRAWGNAPCPCLHSDPQFPDCPAGETRVVRGWLSFYEGDDLDAELARIDATGWQEDE